MDAHRQSITLFVKGMTCSSCEERIQKALLGIPGVVSARANQGAGRVEVEYDGTLTDKAALQNAVVEAGYGVSERKGREAGILLATGILILAACFLINAFGGFRFLPKIDASLGLGMIFVAGLLTSLHCVAMCGGIALSQQTKTDPELSAAGWRKHLSGLQYHGGRILSYTILGGLVGALGAVISLTPLTKGLLSAAAGLFMVFLGVKMLGVFPWMSKFRIRWPRFIPASAMARFRGKGPFFVGLANGFMPCGPLQTMQLYALGTGSAVMGALSMLVFSAGTVPLMFGFGSLSQFFNRNWQRRLIRISALVVVLFGVSLTMRALEVTGVSGAITGAVASTLAGSSAAVIHGNVAVAKIADGVQYASFDLEPGSYKPIVVQKGIPVKWTIRATADNLNGCNEKIIIPSLGIEKKLVSGDNLIEFTPGDVGTVSYTCWMAMISSQIFVVDNLDSPSVAELGAQTPGNALALSNLGAGGCCGVTPQGFAGGKIPTGKIQLAQIKDGVQELVIDVDDAGYSPAVSVVQAGIPVRITFNAKKLSGCNSTVVFPEYNGALRLNQGQLATPKLNPIAGHFTFQCGMNMLHGYVKTVPDLTKVDLNAVRSEVVSYKPSPGAGGAGGGGCCGQ